MSDDHHLSSGWHRDYAEHLAAFLDRCHAGTRKFEIFVWLDFESLHFVESSSRVGSYSLVVRGDS